MLLFEFSTIRSMQYLPCFTNVQLNSVNLELLLANLTRQPISMFFVFSAENSKKTFEKISTANYLIRISVSNYLGPLHIPAKRPGFDADPSVIRHPHPWSSYESAAGYDTQYHSQYILDRERKPLYYGYPDPQFTQVRLQYQS